MANERAGYQKESQKVQQLCLTTLLSGGKTPRWKTELQKNDRAKTQSRELPSDVHLRSIDSHGKQVQERLELFCDRAPDANRETKRPGWPTQFATLPA